MLVALSIEHIVTTVAKLPLQATRVSYKWHYQIYPLFALFVVQAEPVNPLGTGVRSPRVNSSHCLSKTYLMLYNYMIPD
jgi:bacteriorhodopsin